MKNLILIITTLLSFYSHASTKHLNDLSTTANKHYEENIAAKATKKGHILLKRIKTLLVKSSITIDDLNKSETTSFTVNWTINRKTSATLISDILYLYEGEDTEITNTNVRWSTRRRNNLYFKYKPLGQLNGLTFDLNKSDFNEFMKDILQNTIVYIEVSTPNTTHTIPILSTANTPGCDNIEKPNNNDLLCFQTESPTKEDLSIGYENNFKNKFTINTPINDENDIQVKWTMLYKGYKIL